MAMALEGIKVVDLTQRAAGPISARLLADFGADVIHIEPPGIGDSIRPLGGNRAPSKVNYIWENCDRNKRGITLNVSGEQGQEIMYKLLERADVFVTNMRPYEVERYKLDYDTLHQRYPSLIYGQLTGLGKNGPERDAPGMDSTTYWSRAGMPYGLTAPGSLPPSFVGAFGDMMGALHLAFGLTMALYVRERTGIGQRVDVSLFHAGVYQMSFPLSGALVSDKINKEEWMKYPPQELLDKAEEALAPLRNLARQGNPNPMGLSYPTKDGREIKCSAFSPDRYWPRLCRALGREDLEHDPRFNTNETRVKNCHELIDILDKVFATKTLDEWKPHLVKEGVLFSYDQNYREVISDSQARANNFFVPLDHPIHGRIEVVAVPATLSETPATIRMAAPEFGQHNEEVLLELGYTWEDIEQFKQHGTISKDEEIEQFRQQGVV